MTKTIEETVEAEAARRLEEREEARRRAGAEADARQRVGETLELRAAVRREREEAARAAAEKARKEKLRARDAHRRSVLAFFKSLRTGVVEVPGPPDPRSLAAYSERTSPGQEEREAISRGTFRIDCDSGDWSCEACGSSGGLLDAARGHGVPKRQAVERLRELGLSEEAGERVRPSESGDSRP